MPDPYAEFQAPAKSAPATSGDPYAEFQKPAEAPSAPTQPGFFSRLYENTAKPLVDTYQNYAQHTRDNQPKFGVLAGIPALAQTAGDVIGGVGQGMTDGATKTFTALRHGDLGHTLQQAPGMIPLIGPSAVQVGEDAEKGNWSGAAGGATGLLGSLAAPSLTKGLGRGLSVGLAEPVMDAALKTRDVDRAFHRNPARAALDMTSGVRQDSISQSAGRAIGEKTAQMERLVDSSPNVTSLKPVRGIVNSAMDQAEAHNAAGTHKLLQPLNAHVTTNFSTGAPIPENQTPRGMLDLRRGLNSDHITNWKPDSNATVDDTAKSMYHGMNDQIYSAVPEAKGLASDISSLIPVKNRAAAVSRHAGAIQQILGKLTTPTGALASAVGGGFAGYSHGGLPGAVYGAAAGAGIPQMLGSPTFLATEARGLDLAGKALQKPIYKGVTVGEFPRAASLLRSRTKDQSQ